MPASKVALLRPGGLYILTSASLPQLAADSTVADFAGGLLVKALRHTNLPGHSLPTLARALHHSGPEANPLLLSLLVLDADVQAVVDDESRVFPLPGFLSYRSRLLPDRVSLTTVRLPPLNPDGHYGLEAWGDFWGAFRVDVHPVLKVAGHVRLAAGSSTRPPARLLAAEHRLERQILTTGLVETAVAAGSAGLEAGLSPAEQAVLVKLLAQLAAG